MKPDPSRAVPAGELRASLAAAHKSFPRARYYRTLISFASIGGRKENLPLNGPWRLVSEGRGESLGKDLDSGHARIAVHGNKIEEQFPLGIRFQASESAKNHVALARFTGQVEVP